MLCQPSDLLPTTVNNAAFPRYCITHNGEVILQRTWPHEVPVDRFADYTHYIPVDPTTNRRSFCFNVGYHADNFPTFVHMQLQQRSATVDDASAAIIAVPNDSVDAPVEGADSSSPAADTSAQKTDDVSPRQETSGPNRLQKRKAAASTILSAATSICPACKKTLKVDIFPQHRKTCTGSVCPQCAATFYNKYSMQRHIKSKHSSKK